VEWLTDDLRADRERRRGEALPETPSRLSMKISAFERPRMFRDELVRGPLRRLVHDHYFTVSNGGTTMRDVFDFSRASHRSTGSCSFPTSAAFSFGGTK
jgi:hypothetical protein